MTMDFDFTSVLDAYASHPTVLYHHWVLINGLLESGDIKHRLYNAYICRALNTFTAYNEVNPQVGNVILSALAKMLVETELEFETLVKLFNVVHDNVDRWDTLLAWRVLDLVSENLAAFEVCGITDHLTVSNSDLVSTLLLCDEHVISSILNTITYLHPDLDDPTLVNRISNRIFSGASITHTNVDSLVRFVVAYDAVGSLQDSSLLKFVFDNKTYHFGSVATWCLINAFIAKGAVYSTQIWAMNIADVSLATLKSQLSTEMCKIDVDLVHQILLCASTYAESHSADLLKHMLFEFIVKEMLHDFAGNSVIEPIAWHIVHTLVCVAQGSYIDKSLATVIASHILDRVLDPMVSESALNIATCLVRMYPVPLQDILTQLLPIALQNIELLLETPNVTNALVTMLDEIASETEYVSRFVLAFVANHTLSETAISYVSQLVSRNLVHVPSDQLTGYTAFILDSVYQDENYSPVTELAALHMIPCTNLTLKSSAQYINMASQRLSNPETIEAAWSTVVTFAEPHNVSDCDIQDLLKSADISLGIAEHKSETVWRAVAFIAQLASNSAVYSSMFCPDRVSSAFARGAMDAETALHMVILLEMACKSSVDTLVCVLDNLDDSMADMVDTVLDALNGILVQPPTISEPYLVFESVAALTHALVCILSKPHLATDTKIRVWRIVCGMCVHFTESATLLGDAGYCELLESCLADAMSNELVDLKNTLFKAAWKLGSSPAKIR